MTSRLIGRKKGQLTIKGVHSSKLTKAGNLRRNLLAECSCGASYIINESNFAKSKNPACASCKKLSQTEKRAAISDHPLRARWHGMIARCHNPENHNYPNYGARGIEVCQRWRDSFETYVKDVGLPPFPTASLDRIDNNGHYEPSNMRWATPKAQARNTRVVRMYDGLPLVEVEESHGLQAGMCSKVAKKLGVSLVDVANALQKNHSVGQRCRWLEWLGIERKPVIGRPYTDNILSALEGFADELEKIPGDF